MPKRMARFSPTGGTPQEFKEFLTAQMAHWGRVVRDSGIKMHQ